MNEHYYSRNPKSEHDLHEFHTDVLGRKFHFTTDASVFARRMIDYGTRTLIEHLPFPLSGHVLDVGCGYGPIGLTVAALSPEAAVTMVDVNKRALELSRINAVRNKIEQVEILESNALAAVGERYFDWILTNPPIRAGKRVVYSIFEEARQHLRSQGQFWLVIQKKQGAPSAIKKLETLFVNVDVVVRSKGYFVIRCRV